MLFCRIRINVTFAKLNELNLWRIFLFRTPNSLERTFFLAERGSHRELRTWNIWRKRRWDRSARTQGTETSWWWRVTESLNVFLQTRHEDVLRACGKIEKFYETKKDSGNLSAVSNELKAIEEDFTEVEGVVKGYLSNANRSSVKDQTERLKEEVSKQQE